MSEHIITNEDELNDGDHMVVQVEGREIGIFNIDGDYYAYTNWCPHQGGPCAEGNITGTVEATFDREKLETSLEWTDENILNCPWHGWEFKVDSGECLSRRKVRLISHNIRVDDGNLVLSL